MSLKTLGGGAIAADRITGAEGFVTQYAHYFTSKGAVVLKFNGGRLSFIRVVTVDEFPILFVKMVDGAYAYENKYARYVLDAAKVRADAAEKAARDANNNAGIPAARAIYNAALETYKQQIAASSRLPGFLATQEVVIPLDAYHFSDESAMNFLADTARYVRHLTNAASYEPLAPRLAPHEVLDMYVSALSGMLLDLQETGLTKTTADVITTFYRTVKSLLTGSHPESVIAQKNADALAKMPSTSNSLEKFILSVSMDLSMILSMILHVFGTTLMRSWRRVGTAFAYDKGADAMFASVAALSKGFTSPEAFLAEYMRITTARDLALGELSADTPNRMAKSLVAVLTASGLPPLAPLSPETLEAAMIQLVAHLETSPKGRIPWAMWIPTLPGLRAFTYITGEFAVDPKSGIKSNKADSMEIDSNTVTVSPPHGDATGKYVGIQIPTRPSLGQSLVLSCNVEPLGGNAKEATGVKGAGGTNIRVTTGDTCINSKRAGCASSGKTSGGGEFVDSPNGRMNLSTPVVIFVCTVPTGTFAIISNDGNIYGFLVLTAESPLFLAFQQAIVTITGTHQATSTLPTDVQSYLHTAASAASKAASTATSAASTAASVAPTAASNSSSSSNASCSPSTPSSPPPSTEREIGRLEAIIDALTKRIEELRGLTTTVPKGTAFERQAILQAKTANLALLATAQSELETAQKALAALTSAPAKPASPSLAHKIADLESQLAHAKIAALEAELAKAKAAVAASAPSAEAVTWGQELLKLLLSKGSTNKNNKETAENLITKGADLTVTSDESGRRTALLVACSKGNGDIIRALIAKGADINALTPSGGTCHYLLTTSGHDALAATLVKEKLISA